MIVHETLEEALQDGPRKRGVALYLVVQNEDVKYVWARTAQAALAQAVKEAGARAHRFHAGAIVESEVGDGIRCEDN